ncbi:uncharacterized protein [Palaemon carinicauda]|uniref:uncharacterized protein n=1 Tax=Palaemon carinicauda TaxID=392227 RepID=UPI0035B57A42
MAAKDSHIKLPQQAVEMRATVDLNACLEEQTQEFKFIYEEANITLKAVSSIDFACATPEGLEHCIDYRYYNREEVTLAEMKRALYAHTRTKEMMKLMTSPDDGSKPNTCDKPARANHYGNSRSHGKSLNLLPPTRRHKIVAIVSANVGKGINTPGYTRTVRMLEANRIRLADQRPDDNAAGIKIIPGTDYLPRLLKRTHNIQGVNLFSTPASYVVWGELPDWSRPDLDPRDISAVTITINRIDVDSPMTLNPPLENLWKLDTIGITKEPFSHLEGKAVDLFKRTTQYKTGKYVVLLPFKSDKRPASNYARAFAQLMSVKKSKNLQLVTDYRKILDEYLGENFIESVPLGTPVDGKVHYLPHHPAVKNSATTPTQRGIHDYLGLEWDTVNDTLNIKLPPELEISHSNINTKRKVVSLFSSIYDPKGLISPVTILGKLFIQKLWMTDKGSDTPIDPEQVQELSDIIKRYKGLERIKVPRNTHDGSQRALHIFADASKLASGVAAYIVTQEGNSRLLTAKSQVTPKRMLKMDESLTIPKLELTALLLGCRLAKHLSELRPSVTVWSDASTGLQWVHNSKSNFPYVLNRVEEIIHIKLSCNLNLKHVPTNSNPADLASRGVAINVAGPYITELEQGGPDALTAPQLPDPPSEEPQNDDSSDDVTPLSRPNPVSSRGQPRRAAADKACALFQKVL